MGWEIFRCDAGAFDLSHLNDQVILVSDGNGAEIGVLVRFSDHCFTVEASLNDTRPSFPDATRRDGRFCVRRYEASKGLLAHIEYAKNGRVWIGQRDRFLIVKLEAADGQIVGEYVIAFTLERYKGIQGIKLLMRVRTAFKSDDGNKVDTFGEVAFETLVSSALQNRSIRKNFSSKRKRPWK